MPTNQTKHTYTQNQRPGTEESVMCEAVGLTQQVPHFMWNFFLSLGSAYRWALVFTSPPDSSFILGSWRVNQAGLVNFDFHASILFETKHCSQMFDLPEGRAVTLVQNGEKTVEAVCAPQTPARPFRVGFFPPGIWDHCSCKK